MTLHDRIADEIDAVCRGARKKAGLHLAERVAVNICNDLLLALNDRLTLLLSGANMFAYPKQDEFFASAVAVLGHLRGDNKAKNLAHDAYVCAGYGLSMTLGDPTAATAAGATPLTDVQVFEQAVACCGPADGTMKAQALPPGFWAKLIAAALAILQQFFPAPTT